MDTWATSALTPQIATGFQAEKGLDECLFPSSVRPLAHDIIRTWAFYSIVKAQHHFGCLPWKTVMVSGWGLEPCKTKGKRTKISKSRSGDAITPQAMLDGYAADALRYWAASSGLGRDTLISEQRVLAGVKLLTKLWNVARFSERFIQDYHLPVQRPELSLADRWILGRLGATLDKVGSALAKAGYALARMDLEILFWTEWTDNYLEMAKKRLYDPHAVGHAGALYTLYSSLRDMLKGWAPFIPYITEEIYQALFAQKEEDGSVHRTAWPQVDACFRAPSLEQAGKALVAIATRVRRWKSEGNIPLGRELATLRLRIEDAQIQALLTQGLGDIASITRARSIVFEKGGVKGLETTQDWEIEEGIGMRVEA
jgi:valyl-tRNA synthetase